MAISMDVSGWLNQLREEFEQLPQDICSYPDFSIVKQGIFTSTLDFVRIVLQQYLQELHEPRNQQQSDKDSQPLLNHELDEHLSISESCKNIDCLGSNIKGNEHILLTNQQTKDHFLNHLDQSTPNHKTFLKALAIEQLPLKQLKQKIQLVQSVHTINTSEDITEEITFEDTQRLAQYYEQLEFCEFEQEIEIAKFLVEEEFRQTTKKFVRAKIPEIKIMIEQLLAFLKSAKMNLFNSQKAKIAQCKSLCNKKTDEWLQTYNISQIQKLMAEIMALKHQLKERTFNNQEFCKFHKKKVQYICINQQSPQKKYICLQCEKEDPGLNNLHQGHKILCKQHRQPVTLLVVQPFRIKNNHFQYYSHVHQGYSSKFSAAETTDAPDLEDINAQSNVQRLICEKCYQVMMPEKNVEIAILASCHLFKATKVCVEPECIFSNKFKVCVICQFKHQGHRMINFDKSSLLKYFHISQEHNIVKFESLYLDIRQILNLQLIKKVVDKSVNQLWRISKFIEAFAISNDQVLKKWIDLILSQGEKEDVFLLFIVDELNKRNLEENKKRDYLEVFKDKLSDELGTVLDFLAQQMQSFKQRVEKMMYMQEKQIEDYLSKKHREFNIEGNKAQGSWKIFDIEEVNLRRIQKMVISSETDCWHDEKIVKKQQNELRNFYTYTFRQMCKQWEKDKKMQLCEEDRKFLIHKVYPNLYSDEMERYQYQNLICQMRIQLTKIRSDFYIQSRSCPLIDIVLNHNLTNLQILSICFKPPHLTTFQFQSTACKYAVNAFGLFEAINYMPVLRVLQIKGFEVIQFELFVRSKAAVDVTGYINNEKYANLKDWLHEFNPSVIDLSMEAEFLFRLNNSQESSQEQVKYYSRFVKLFKSVSYISISVKIELKIKEQFDIQVLKKVLNFVSLLNYIKLNLDIKVLTVGQRSFFIKVLQLLCFVTSIEELVILFDSFDAASLGKDESLVVEQYVREILVNNKIKSFTCKKMARQFCFIDFSRATSLQHIHLQGLTSQLLTKFIRNNPSLETIQTYPQWEMQTSQHTKNDDLMDMGNQCLQKLQVLMIKFPSFPLQILQGSSLKKLHIGKMNSNHCERPGWQALFPKLKNLTELVAQLINLDGRLLMTIPSPHLQKLSLVGNDLIINDDIWAVGDNWPFLTHLKIINCDKVNGKVFQRWKFKGLVQLHIQKKMLKESNSILDYLKRKGIDLLVESDVESDE